MNHATAASPPRRSIWLWPVVAGSVAFGLWAGRLWERGELLSPANGEERVITPRAALEPDERATVDLFRRCSPSVVHITRIAVRRDFFSRNITQIPEGTGSGFVWDARGHVVTNFHVIQGGDKALVTLSDQSTWDAEVVGLAPDYDLAVLRIEVDADRLRPIDLGTSADLLVGQKAFAIGNPFGLDQTLTTGIVSALEREIESVSRRPIQGMIQTDAAVNPGNSGGPLLDSAGRLIGVNTAIYSPSGASAGIGFALPVDTVRRIVPQLILHGKVIRPGLGIRVAEDSLARRLGIQRGVLVIQVVGGSEAERAGLRPTRRTAQGRLLLGDILLDLAGKPLKDVNDLYLALEGRQIGESVKVGVYRDGGRTELKVVLEAVQ